MPPTRSRRTATSRVDILTRDMKNLSTSSTSTSDKLTNLDQTGSRSFEGRVTRARAKREKLTLVEVTNTLTIPGRRQRRVRNIEVELGDTSLVDNLKSIQQELEAISDALGDLLDTPTVKPHVVKPATVKTSFLLVSDTHDVQPKTSNEKYALFRHPFPKTDVFIHAGDMTQHSGLLGLKKVISWVEAVPAELKILIAGNHDHSLDATNHKQNESDSDSDSESVVTKGRRNMQECREYIMSEEMKAKGIHYLENEFKSFKLSNGASLTIFASPYTPRGPWPHNGGSFRYDANHDLWEQFQTSHVLKSGEVDVTVIHGPAYGILDRTSRGKSVGCRSLRKFLAGVRPLMSVCGHIHEAAGVKVLEWDDDGESDREKDLKGVRNTEEAGAVFTDARSVTEGLVKGKETIFVNASLVGAGSSSYTEAARCPYVLELELPVSAV